MVVMMAMERTHLHRLRIRKNAGACQVRRDAGRGLFPGSCGSGAYVSEKLSVSFPSARPDCLSRANTPRTTRSQRYPINGNAFFPLTPTRAKSLSRIIARPRCRRTFTFCSVRSSAGGCLRGAQFFDVPQHDHSSVLVRKVEHRFFQKLAEFGEWTLFVPDQATFRQYS